MSATNLLLFSLGCLLSISGTLSSEVSNALPSRDGSKSTTEIMDTIFRNYDKRIRPDFEGKPVEVTVSAYILDLYDINELSHQFTANMYFRHSWVDPRMTFQPPPGVEHIHLNASEIQNIWAPDTFIVNERSSSIHSFTIKNEFYRVKPDGVVLRSTRVTVTASCIMDLKWFPFDRHTCTLNLESYAYTVKDIIYTIPLERLGVSNETHTSIQFSIQAVKTTATIFDKYSRASIEIFIKRNPLRYIQDIFFPAIAFPIVAFITMCTGSLQSRVHLSVLILSAMLIFQTMISTSMPKVSYQTALDFYVFNSSVMIFNVVITNFLMYHLMKPKDAHDDKMPLTRVNGNTDDNHSATDIPSDFRMGPPKFSNRAMKILFMMFENNKYSMPIFFVIFNILYWPIVLIASNTFPEDFILLENHGV